MIRALVRLLPRLPLAAWLVMSHGAVLIPPIVVLAASGSLADDLRDQTRVEIEHQGTILSMYVRDLVHQARSADPDAGIGSVEPQLGPILRDVKSETQAGIQVVDASGRVVATSGTTLGTDLSAEPEVEAALEGTTGSSVKPRPMNEYHPLSSASRRANVRVFVAVPVVVDQHVIGAIVMSRTPREELQALYMMNEMAPGVLGALIVAPIATVALAGMAAFFATRSLRRLDRGALRIADGDFGGLDDLVHPRESHVSEVGQTANALVTMTERLRDRLAYISEFASNVSHEFKTPIATLRGTVELLSDDPEMAPDQRARFLSNANRELDRLERMVSGLLSLARADELRTRSPLALDDLLTGIAADAGVALTGSAGTVLADRAQVEAVAKNLIENARRHGGEGVSVSIEAFREVDRTGFRVCDDGKGISEANLAKVFDRFFTTDRASGGTGLGLALVRAIAIRHGGDVQVTSRPPSDRERGRTVFEVSLPVGGVS